MSATQFEALIRLLKDLDAEFVVVGGLAAVVHGSAYVTYDLDVCYGRSADNVERLCRALSAVHPSLRAAGTAKAAARLKGAEGLRPPAAVPAGA